MEFEFYIRELISYTGIFLLGMLTGIISIYWWKLWKENEEQQEEEES